MLCLDEPYASAIFAGLKRWETRTAPPNGDMRPDGVRGFPGVKVNRGDRIIIAAGEGDGIAMHPGHILGTVTVTDALPIVADCDDLPDAPPLIETLIETLGEPLRMWPEGAMDLSESVDISDQLSWGDWTPGRWAWRLADPIPTTEQCPWCMGQRKIAGTIPGVPSSVCTKLSPCPICWPENEFWDDGTAGRCPPIPVTGHQGLRVWDGTVRR